MAAEVSAPVLVYEKPRFNEPMFLKAKDAPLPTRNVNKPEGKSPKSEKIREESSKTSSTPPLDRASSRHGSILRRLSFRARSYSQGKDSTASEPNMKRTRSFAGMLPRRLSSLFGTSAETSKSVTKPGPVNNDLVVFVQE